MTDLIKKLNIDEDSFVYLLNFIMDNLKEDRELALRHHDTLSHMLDGPNGLDSMSGVELSILLNDLSESITKFLSNASMATDRAIKILKIMSDLMAKVHREDGISDEDREYLESLTSEFEVLKEDTDEDIDDIKIQKMKRAMNES